jgi:O-antigen ligase
MNETSAETATGWSSSRSTSRPRIRRRDVIPPLIAVLFLTFAHVLFGATQPMTALVLSAGLIAAAIASVFAAGSRHITFGMIAGVAVLWAFALTGAAGKLDRAAADLAVLFAAGAMWTIGYISARKRGATDIVWAGLVWSSFTYCAWMFFDQMGGVLSGSEASAITDGFESPASASIIFGLLTLVGSARVLHVVKQMDAEALARSEMIDRLMRDALGGMLLLVFAVACLGLSGSRVGILLTTAVLLGHIWWDTRAITSRSHRGAIIRFARRLAPLAAMAFAVGGVGLAWLRDESIAPGLSLSDTLPHIQRMQAYVSAWAESPLFGYGLGSADVVGDRAMTLANAKAMLAPGDVQNLFVHWLVEGGVVGFAAILLFIGAMHVRIVASIGRRRAPRTFTRLAIAAGALMLLHGVSDSALDLPGVVWLYALLLGAAAGVATTKSSSQSAASQ